jgi:hypothetical protein
MKLKRTAPWPDRRWRSPALQAGEGWRGRDADNSSTQISSMNLNQVTLPAADLEASASFYRRMGFTQIVSSPHYARFECPEGDATFSIHEAVLDADEIPASRRALALRQEGMGSHRGTETRRSVSSLCLRASV